MDDAKAVRAIQETLERPRIGGVQLKLKLRSYEHVLVHADYEPDRSLTLTAELVGITDLSAQEDLRRFGWLFGAGQGRQLGAGRGRVPRSLRRTWTNVQPETAIAVATEARRALERVAPDDHPRGLPLVAIDAGLMDDPLWAQAGCIAILPSLLIGLGIVALLRLLAGQALDGGHFLLLAVIGYVATFAVPASLVSLAVRIPALRPYLERIAYGGLFAGAGIVVLITDRLLGGG